MTTRYFNKALSVGRPPNIQKLFPNSKALLVSGKFINSAIIKKTESICIAANARNIFIIEGVLKAAQRANSVVIIEIAKSEGGSNAYCAINYWNIARIVDALCNKLRISIPVAIHADHYSIKTNKDISESLVEIPTMFEAGITSLAIDASHLPDDLNLLTSIKLNRVLPDWSGLETEIGEIKGELGLSTKDEATFMVQGLNAHDIFPDWIALNNGTVHGIESNGLGINIKLTSEIHNALLKYGVYGAQHGTSGNSKSKLKELTLKTHTTKANIATALQMISWGVKINENGNAIINKNGNFVKVRGKGMSHNMWLEMKKYAENKNWHGGNYKNLNLPFENKLLAQPKKIRNRMVKDVENFIYDLSVNVFNSEDTAQIAIESILEANNHRPKQIIEKTEDPTDWTPTKISKKMSKVNKNNGPRGCFDD